MTFPIQENSIPRNSFYPASHAYDMRSNLNPRRLAIVMWDQAFLMRHLPGESFADYRRTLDETIERGYNVLRLDPLPQLIDLAKPETEFSWSDPGTPFMPWGWDKAGSGPLGKWLIEFMEEALRRRLHYTLSAWWFTGQSNNNRFPPQAKSPTTHAEAAELWAVLLRQWRARFGFEGLVYVDLANEVPYFLPGFIQRFQEQTGQSWGSSQPAFTLLQITFLAHELNTALAALRSEFPELRFTASIHGDERWLDVPVNFDCLDVHFYADADPRWSERTRFSEHTEHLFTDSGWHADFSRRCELTARSVGPMLRAHQRARLFNFSAWSQRFGMPLTTSESWASWFYIDSPDLDWGWLLEWAEWSVEDAIAAGMWGWTPHNYCQPQFRNWQDVRWHRRLTERFLRS